MVAWLVTLYSADFRLVRSTMEGLICLLQSDGCLPVCTLCVGWSRSFAPDFMKHRMQLSLKSIHYSFPLLHEGSPEPGRSGYTGARTSAPSCVLIKPEI